MLSIALHEWSSVRAARLNEIESGHRGLGGSSLEDVTQHSRSTSPPLLWRGLPTNALITSVSLCPVPGSDFFGLREFFTALTDLPSGRKAEREIIPALQNSQNSEEDNLPLV
jgi:hypothetical protein